MREGRDGAEGANGGIGAAPRGQAGATDSALGRKLLPLVLAPCVLLLDQITKAAAVARLEPYRPVEVLGEWARFDLKWNTAVAFSLGHTLPLAVQRALFPALQIAVVGLLLLYYFRTREVTRGQRWILGALVGGGLGNVVDRLFRSGRVVDFIDMKFWGIFGMERWPTFNVADATVVVGGIAFLLSSIIVEARRKG